MMSNSIQDRKLKELIETLAGQRGNDGNRAVLVSELKRLEERLNAATKALQEGTITQVQADVQSAMAAAQAASAAADAVQADLNTEVAALNAQAQVLLDQVQQLNVDYAAAEAAADAAETAKTAAETSATNASTSAASASTSATSASTAATNAGTSAALAASSQQIAAQITSRGTGVLSDQFLSTEGADNWTRVGGQGNLTRVPNEAFTMGQTWRFTVASGQTDGLQTESTDTQWRGASGASAYVVEVDYTLASGDVSVEGANLEFQWVNTSGVASSVVVALAAATRRSPIVANQMLTAIATVQRPEGFTGTFSFNRLIVRANNGSALATAAKTIGFHRIALRPASAEEIGQGAVGTAISAAVGTESAARATETAALASQINSVSADVGDLSASVTSQASSIATINANMAATFSLRAVAGSAGAQLELIASSDPLGTASVARISADDILLTGSVGAPLIAAGAITADRIASGGGGNLLQNTDFLNGTLHWAFHQGGSTGAQTTWGVRPPGAWAGASYPVLFMYQNGAANDDHTAVYTSFWRNGSVETFVGPSVTPGAWYEASSCVSAHRCVAEVSVQFFDANNAWISEHTLAQNDSITGPERNPELWPRIGGKVQAPSNATTMRIVVRKFGTKSGSSDSWCFIHKPQIVVSHQYATELSPYSNGAATVIEGGSIRTSAISVISPNVGLLRTATSGARMEIHSDRILVFDASGNVRVRIGNLA